MFLRAQLFYFFNLSKVHLPQATFMKYNCLAMTHTLSDIFNFYWDRWFNFNIIFRMSTALHYTAGCFCYLAKTHWYKLTGQNNRIPLLIPNIRPKTHSNLTLQVQNLDSLSLLILACCTQIYVPMNLPIRLTLLRLKLCKCWSLDRLSHHMRHGHK